MLPEGLTLRGILSSGRRATLHAVDGAVIGNVSAQLDPVPADASHLVLSAGGQQCAE